MRLLQEIRELVEVRWGIDRARVRLFTQWERDLGADPGQVRAIVADLAALHAVSVSPAALDGLDTVGDVVALLTPGPQP